MRGISFFRRYLHSLADGRMISKRPTSRKARPLTVEPLQDRLAPAVLFGSYPSGTWAFNQDTYQWRKIDTARPAAMDEGADGTLFASYSNGMGTWRYTYGSNTWQRVSWAYYPRLSAATDNTLFASNDYGTNEIDASGVHQLTTAVAYHLAAVADNYFYGDFYGATYRFVNGNWRNLGSGGAVGNGGNPMTFDLEAAPNGNLYASYSNGTSVYNPREQRWHLLTYECANQIRYGDSFYTNSNDNPELLSYYPLYQDPNVYNLVYLSFSGSKSGVYSIWDNGYGTDNGSEHMTQLTSGLPIDITADRGRLFAAFGNDGTWTYGNGRWDKVDWEYAADLA